jgi:hypothetical protein
MKKNTSIYISILSLLFLISAFSSCKNVKLEDDYYYTETETVDGMTVTLKGKGYGLYGQMIAKYKPGSIKELMAGKAMKIRTSSADDNNSSYNEIYLTFDINGNIKSFETDVSALKKEGLSQVKVSYIDDNDKEVTISASKYLSGKLTVNKKIKSITLFIRAYKFYPSSESQLTWKENITAEEYKNMAGKQVDNEISINYIKVER